MRSQFAAMWTLAWLGAAASVACGQEGPGTVLNIEFIGGGKIKDAVPALALRPKRPSEFAIELKNAHTDTLRKVTATLVQALPGKKIRRLAEAKVELIAVGAKELLAFEEIKGAPKGPLEGPPPYQLQLLIDGVVNKAMPQPIETVKVDLNLTVPAPSTYVEQKATVVQGANGRRLTIKVTDNLSGVPEPHQCPVNLVLGPEFVPNKQGNYKAMLDKAKTQGFVFSDNLRLDFGLTRGRVYLDADGYERAFTYDYAPAGQGSVNRHSFGTEIGARVILDRYRKPDAKFIVPLELDGPFNDDYRVKVALDRTGEKAAFGEEQIFVGLRKKEILVTVGPAKNLVLLANVSDWRPQFDTADFSGTMWLRVQVFNSTRKDPTVPGMFRETLDTSAELLPGKAEMKTEDDAKTLDIPITQDDTKVEGITFVNLAKDKEWPKGEKVPVQVSITKRRSSQAPVEKVILVRGKAPKEKDEIKPEDLFGKEEAPDKDKSTWTFNVPAQPDGKPVVVTAQFTTKTGVTSSETETIHYLTGDANKTGKTLATIKGFVISGDFRQPEKPVVLVIDAKTQKTTKTNKKGEFEFKDVPPGTYKIVVDYTELFRVYADKTVQVMEGDRVVNAGELSVLQKTK